MSDAFTSPVCRCRKVRYLSRKDARRAARRAHAGEHMSAYPCPAGTGCYHLGHLPQNVVTGEITRDEIKSRDQFKPRRTAS